MTSKDLDRVSRSWVGHVATSPGLRDKMNQVLNGGTDEDMADLINQTVVPKDNVAAEHVPAIKEHINRMLAAAARPGDGTTLQFTGH